MSYRRGLAESPKLAWQGRVRRYPLPYAMTAGDTGGDDRFYAPGYAPGVVESPGFLAPPAVPIAPAAPTAPAAATGGSGLDLSGIMGTLTSLPWWIYAGAAYFLFFRKGR